MMRQCGDCQLCCKLLPVVPLGKGAGEKCRHQKFGKGCSVYHTAAMPPECGLWNCRWLVGDDTDELSRPDRSHYVIDVMPDFVTLTHNDTGETQHVEVVQIWIDPKHPEVHREPALRRYMVRRAEQGIAAIVRFDAHKALIVFAPPLSSDRKWHEIADGKTGPTHSPREVARTVLTAWLPKVAFRVG
jgi:hypothetical protein